MAGRKKPIHRVLQGYLDTLQHAADSQQLRGAMAAIAAEFDLRSFAYLAMPTALNKKPRLISTYAEDWTTHYLARRYENADPVILRALRDNEPFDWGPDLAVASNNTRNFFNEAADFGIRYGFTIPIPHWKGRMAAVTFATDRRRPEYRACIRHNARTLQLIAYQFHASVCENLEARCAMGGVWLTPRQCQCLEWARRGKSAGDIAQLLGIMRRTVKFHLDHAKAKLGVRTICQAAVAFDHAKREA